MELESKWFVVNLLYESVKSGYQNVTNALEKTKQEDEEGEVFEERHFLIKAKNQDHAQLIGHSLGIKNELSYHNVYGEKVNWKYKKLLECFEMIDDLGDGSEIYSRYILCPKGTTTDEMIRRYFPEE